MSMEVNGDSVNVNVNESNVNESSGPMEVNESSVHVNVGNVNKGNNVNECHESSVNVSNVGDVNLIVISERIVNESVGNSSKLMFSRFMEDTTVVMVTCDTCGFGNPRDFSGQSLF